MAPRDRFVETPRLAEAQACLQIRHPVVVAELDLLVVPRPVRPMRHLRRFARDAVASEKLQAPREPGVICEGHAAFGGGHDLYRVEAEHCDFAVLAAAHRLAF